VADKEPTDMNGTPLLRVAVVCLSLVLPVPSLARQTAGPVINHAILQVDTGIVSIAGAHLGGELHVTIDGQPATVLPGATDTRMDVQAPLTLLTMPGTYRLIVEDLVRRTWDGFVLASPAALAGGDRVHLAVPDVGSAANGSLPRAETATVTVGTESSGGPGPLSIIEDTLSPFRTAIGHQALLANSTGLKNTAAGFQALALNTVGNSNTAVGAQALTAHLSGSGNTAVGGSALFSSTSGSSNTAIGMNALFAATTATANTAVGQSALAISTTGVTNTAVGFAALSGTTTGSNNTAIGSNAGGSAATGAYNIFIGAGVTGQSTDSNTIRIGSAFNPVALSGQNKTFVAGVHGTVLTGPAVPVFVDQNGQLGTLTPAPIGGPIDTGMTPGTAPSTDAALVRELGEQRALIAALQARLAALEAAAARPPRRRR
jgi:hypothetical protein